MTEQLVLWRRCHCIPDLARSVEAPQRDWLLGDWGGCSVASKVPPAWEGCELKCFPGKSCSSKVCSVSQNFLPRQPCRWPSEGCCLVSGKLDWLTLQRRRQVRNRWADCCSDWSPGVGEPQRSWNTGSRKSGFDPNLSFWVELLAGRSRFWPRLSCCCWGPGTEDFSENWTEVCRP